MRIKLDENLPQRLASTLKTLGHDVHTIYEQGLTGSSDSQVWEAVQSEKRFLITQDLDFADARKFLPGTHHGILLVRLRSPGRMSLVRRLAELFTKEAVEQWLCCFVVVTDQKIRLLRPQGTESQKA